VSAAHLHLILNHVPVLGTFFAATILAIALVLRHPAFQKVALVFFVGLGLSGVAVYLSGERAAAAIRLLPGIAVPSIQGHEEAGEAAFVFLSLLGAAALLLLILYRGDRPLPLGAGIGILFFALIVLILAARAAWIGGHIRHPEIWSGAAIGARHGGAPT